MTELFFEHADLRGQCRLRHVQRLGGTRQVAFLGHGPEVMQVVEIQPAHISFF